MPTIQVAPAPPVAASDSLRSPSRTGSSARDGPKKKLTATAVATAQRLMAPVLQSARERSEIAAFVVWCSPRTFCVLWCVILLLHILNIGIVARSLYSWIRTERDPEEVAKALRNVGIRFSHSTMRGVIVSGSVALTWHCVYVWRALSNSIRHRQLLFDRLPCNEDEQQQQQKKKESGSLPSSVVHAAIFQSTRHLLHQLERMKSVRDSVTSFLDSRSQRSASSWLRVVWTTAFLAWKALNACVGAFGIRGQYFDVGFHLRELFEISVQTYQAYNINYLVPQDWVSFLSLCVVVLNCWTTPLLHAIFRRDVRLRRVWCLGVDVALDFFSSMLLPFFVYTAYRRLIVQADWYNPVWIMQTANALLCFHTNSPLDLIARVLPNLSMLSCLGAIQPLLRAQPSDWNSAARTEERASLGSKPTPDASVHPQQQQQQHRRQRRLHQLLMVHGLGVIVLQAAAKLQADMHPIVGCQLGTKRWFATKSTCAVLELNCHRRNWTGAAEELDSALTRVDEQALAALIVSHCPSAELSRSLHRFPNLAWLEVFNSTLVDWPSRAAPSDAHNPRLSRVLMVRTNFTTGFPSALLSMDGKDDPNEQFPTTLIDIEFVATNLTELPVDVGRLWPDALSTFLVESSRLSAVPAALGVLDVDVLSLAGNNITSLPVELANGTDFLLLSVANNPLQSLPNVSSLMRPWRVQTLAIDQTSVQYIQAPHNQTSVISKIFASEAPNTTRVGCCSSRQFTLATQINLVQLVRSDNKNTSPACLAQSAEDALCATMRRSHTVSNRLQCFHLECSRPVFRVVWWLVLSLNALHAGALARATYSLIRTLRFPRRTRTLLRAIGEHPQTWITGLGAVCATTITCLHVIEMFRLLRRSLQRRRLCFLDHELKPFRREPTTSRLRSSVHALRLRLNHMRRLCSIRGPYFEHAFHAREILEISLQTVQAYRVSYFVAHPWVNQLAIAVIVLNCWSSALIYHVFPHHQAKRRALCLLIDILLDMTSSIVIPYIVYGVYRYLLNYEDYYDPLWIRETANDLLQVTNVSMLDLLARLMAAGSIVISLQTVQTLIKPNDSRGKILEHRSVGSTQSAISSSSQVFADRDGPHRLAAVATSVAPQPHTPVVSRHRPRWISVLHGLFVIYGFLGIAVSHRASRLADASHKQLPGCHASMRHWLALRYPCSVLEINCYRRQLQGSADELSAILAQLDPYSLGGLIISHCARIEMPSAIHAFPYLFWLEIYNSTLHEWPATAALSSSSLPRLSNLALVHVNTTESLPRGLLPRWNRFERSTLQHVAIIHSNLSLPDELLNHWKSDLDVLVIEYCRLRTVPPAVTSLHVTVLSLAANELKEVPSSLVFERTVPFDALSLAGNPLTALPDRSSRSGTVVFASTHDLHIAFKGLYIENTAIATLPTWARDDGICQRVDLFAGGAPLCATGELKEMQCGEDFTHCGVDVDGYFFPMQRHAARRVP